MVSGYRTYLRVGGIWLLFAALAHSVGHWLTYVSRTMLMPDQREPLDMLLATPGGQDIWALFNQFSMAFTLFLLLAGTASVIASRRSVPLREARDWSGFSAAFWSLAFLVFLLEPVPPALIISGAAAVLHVAAFLTAANGGGRMRPAWKGASDAPPVDGRSPGP